MKLTPELSELGREAIARCSVWIGHHHATRTAPSMALHHLAYHPRPTAVAILM